MKLAVLFVVFFSGSLALAQTAVDREEAITIGGIQQYITIKGGDSSLPLLLFLHGGPGGSVMHYSQKFTDRLQEHFLVVQWDQRETGRTLGLNASPRPITVSLFQDDTHELIKALLKRFQRAKIYLAAHSWGTALGFQIARACPELLYAYMPIGPMINQLESERIALSLMKDKARKSANERELEELARVRIPFENGEQLYLHRKWLLDLAGSRKKLSKSYVEDWATRWLKVFNDASEENLIETLPVIGCPVYFFVGRKDYQTNSDIAEQYYTILKAPKKGFFWFEFSAHAVPTSEPDRLQQLIIDKVLPETFTIQKAATLIGDR
jgi:pimeloyl-ACP methyl ester carboxylesterase